jgi:hypothetical protein
MVSKSHLSHLLNSSILCLPLVYAYQQKKNFRSIWYSLIREKENECL